jgi:hypothetical protein
LDPKGPTVLKGLLWAERGRSRILINQFVVANKLHQDEKLEINKLVNFDFTDQVIICLSRILYCAVHVVDVIIWSQT